MSQDPEEIVRRGNEALAALPREVQAAAVVLGMRATAQALSRSLVQLGLMQAETADLDDVVKVIARMWVLQDAIRRAAGILRPPRGVLSPGTHEAWKCDRALAVLMEATR